ncbi:MAG TPA: polyprenyl synthetase family protein [Rubrobacter sp.]|nr:polyprenyl synthetase family protein [Rubrobacter sp.]
MAGRQARAEEEKRMRGRAARVFDALEELVSALPVPPEHRELLRVHLKVGEEQAEAWPAMAAIQLPLLVHAAISGVEGPALPVAAACTLLYLGADLFDSVQDHELPAPWRGRGPAEATLAASTLVAALPQLSVASLGRQGTPPEKLWVLARLFADTLLSMSAGQHQDLVFPDSEDVSLEQSRAMVERKSGSDGALFAKAGAILATEDAARIGAYAAFGSCHGTARQLITDVWDIWANETSRDLLNGKRTLPVVHALCVLQGKQRERLRGLLAAARESGEHHDEVRAALEATGSVRYAALIVRFHQRRARAHLVAARPEGTAARELHALLDLATLPAHREEV